MDSLKNGVQNPEVIDLIAHDPQSDEVVLGMYEERVWDGSEQRLFELEEKLNTYFSFALDGEMLEHYPHFKEKKIRIQLNAYHTPDSKAFDFLERIKKEIPPGFEFVICIPDPSQKPEDCGSENCGCKGS